MSAASNRGLPPAIIVAAAGALIAAGALLLPWYSLNVEAFKTLVMRIVDASGMGGPGSVFEGAPMEQLVTAQMDSFVKAAEDELLGYKVFRPLSVAVHVLGAVGVLVVVQRVVSGAAAVGSQRGELVGGAAILALRPIIGLVNSPTAEGSKQMNLDVDVLTPAAGLYVALFGAILVLLAALWVHLEARGAEDLALSTVPQGGAAYVPGGAPGVAAGPQPQVHVPAPYMPGSPYVPGQQQAAAPQYPQQPQQPAPYGQQQQAPYPQAPAAPAYGQPAPPAPTYPQPVAPPPGAQQGPPPDRSGSVPPPGLG